MRSASVSRRTAETDVAVSIALDGTGKAEISTGVGFLDHMLELFARHGLFDLSVKVTGDLHVDQHHTAEDTGIALGQAFLQALGDKKGITRYADIHLPMDETLTRVALDISGRPFLVFRTTFPTEKIGVFDTELVREWFSGLRDQCGPDAACGDALRREQPPYRGELLQGPGAGLASGGRAWTRGKRAAFPPPRARCKDAMRMTTYTLHLPRRCAAGRSGGPGAGRAGEGRLLLGGLLLHASCGSATTGSGLPASACLCSSSPSAGLMAVLDVHPLAGTIAQLLLRCPDRARGQQPQALDPIAPRPSGWSTR